MESRKLAFVLALGTSLLAGQATAQSAPTAALQLPGAMVPIASETASTQPVTSAFGVEQPAPFTSNLAQPSAAPAAPPAVQQPTALSASSAAPTSQSGAPLIAPPIQQPTPLVAVATPSAASPEDLPVQQPTPFAATTTFPPPPATSPVQQPTPFVAVGGPPATHTTLQQPSAIGPPPPPTAFASYYDEDDEDEDYDEDYDLDGDDDDDVDCSDEASCDERHMCCGFELGGWIEQGFTFNPYDPADGNNGTVILNDLANQWQMNQLWFYADREVDNGGCGWDWGGRFDVLFGTDGEYFQMLDGLEESWGQTGHYQVAFLRFYLDAAYDDWTFRIGRWDTPVGYEPFDATESFFYSRSYNFYAQPGSLLGMFLTRHLNDQWSVSGGVHRGDMQFDDTDGKNALGFIGGFSWLSCDEESWFDAYLETGEEGVGVDVVDYSLIYGTSLFNNWDYVAEWYYGQDHEFGQQFNWYGLNQHFTREINDCWSHGFRFEWFRDDDGFIITDFARRRPDQDQFNGNFYELTYAINYQPCENFVLRPELRFDWFDPSGPNPQPFDDGTKNNQFLLSIDAIYAF
jgi:hypothetical protein